MDINVVVTLVIFGLIVAADVVYTLRKASSDRKLK